MSGRNQKMLLLLAGVVAVAVAVVVFVTTQKPAGDLPILGTAVQLSPTCSIQRSCSCAGINISNSTYTGQTWTKCNLSGANFTGANVSGGKFDQADLSLLIAVRSANGTRANFTGAIMTGANLSAVAGNLSMSVGTATGANLTDADLTNVNLKGANLSHANLTGAIMTGALTDSTTIFCQTTMPDGTVRTDAGKTC